MARCAFKPILVEEGRQRRLAELDLPEDAEQRGLCFLALARETEDRRRAFRPVARAGLGSSAEAEIDRLATRRRRELEMRGLVQQNIGLCVAAHGGAVPAEILARIAAPDPHAERRQKLQCLGMMSAGGAASGPRRRGGLREPAEDGAGGAAAERRLAALQQVREAMRGNRRQDHRWADTTAPPTRPAAIPAEHITRHANVTSAAPRLAQHCFDAFARLIPNVME